MPPSDPSDPEDLGVDPAEVDADEQLVEDVRAGRAPATSMIGASLAAWQAEINAALPAPPIFAELAERYGLDVADEPRDVADLNDSAAADPTPDEITHPDHPDHVEPWDGA